MMEREIATVLPVLFVQRADPATVAEELRMLLESRLGYNSLITAITRRLPEFLATRTDVVLEPDSPGSGWFWYTAMWAQYGPLEAQPLDVLLLTVALMPEAEDVRAAVRQVCLGRLHIVAASLPHLLEGA